MIEKDWHSPHSVTRFTKPMVKWLVPMLPLLRNGEYPPDPRAADSGYTGGSGKPQVKPGAKFELPASIAAELDKRIQAAGLDGLLMEFLYAFETEDEVFLIEHIVRCLNCTSEGVSQRIRNALYYVSGANRKAESYSDFVKNARHYLREKG